VRIRSVDPLTVHLERSGTRDVRQPEFSLSSGCLYEVCHDVAAHLYLLGSYLLGSGPFLTRTVCIPRRFLPATMTPKPQRSKRRDGVLSSLNVAIDAMNIAKDLVDITPAKAAFDTVSVILTMIRVRPLPLPVGRLLDNVFRTPW
jgi:hypothetical protein